MPFFKQINFHTKAFTFLLLLGLASLATVHDSLPSATSTAKTIHARTALGQAPLVNNKNRPLHFTFRNI